MRLKRIKLAGFKSFVEPTSVSLPHNLIGVVGPNGCGKSNIIDAVRWVMGESSAKYLRGDSMDDVIFNGSSSRKPVGKAFVELIFDNNAGRVEGPYAQYSEINVRREVTRDGQSKYFLNKSRCRRRDVMDLFLGTGLGPRSYSIIEQGMVNKIIEAKPEELRLFVEEAAGISKYKERRRETENRIRHSRENLERVQDIRDELERQLRRLQRQSRTAERYRELKQKERELKSQLAALRWQSLGDQLQQHERKLAGRETELESVVSSQRQVEREIEESRDQLSEGNQKFNTVQAEFYEISANIARVEQSIKHIRQQHEERRREKEGLERAISELRADLKADETKRDQLAEELTTDQETLEQARQALNQANTSVEARESGLQRAQDEWESLERDRAERKRAVEISRVERREAEQRLARRVASETRLSTEFNGLSALLDEINAPALKQKSEQAQTQAEALQVRLKTLKGRREGLETDLSSSHAELGSLKEQRQSIDGRLQSLLEIQQADLGEVADWSAETGLENGDLLYQHVRVEKGWEKALDRVLGHMAKGWAVDSDKRLAHLSEAAPDGVALVAKKEMQHLGSGESLLSRLHQGVELLAPLLSGVYAVEQLPDALALQPSLKPHERIVTRDGCLLGANWLLKPGADTTNVLTTAAQIEELREQLKKLESAIEKAQTQWQALTDELAGVKTKELELTGALSEAQSVLNRAQAELVRAEAKREQTQSRLAQLSDELKQLRLDIGTDNTVLESFRHSGSEQDLAQDENLLKQRVEARNQARNELESARSAEVKARSAVHETELHLREKQTRLDSLQENIQRLRRQLTDMDQRREQVLLAFSDTGDPVAELQNSLEALLGDRVQVQHRLDSKRDEVSALDAQIRKAETRRSEFERDVEAIRAELERSRMERQELAVRRDTLREQMLEHGSEPEVVCASLPADLEVAAVETEADRIGSQINGLGPVNLAAIDEYEETKQRKAHLDSQYDDLTRALELLEESIRKINRETRTRFKETFDHINTGFQQFFPQLFGGGHAVLELTSDDMLDAGVSVMARPPGKRNSTIHLLSGGEKALTAVSLVFAIFQLNPAPFCLLDEVDAPLDDANVRRYTEILAQLSAQSQLIFITHNKITMDAADILIGVTMGEPGVSRLVAVDIDQAVEMAAQAVA